MTSTLKTYTFQIVVFIAFFIGMFFLLRLVNQKVVGWMAYSGMDRWDRADFDDAYCGGLKNISCPNGYMCVKESFNDGADGKCVFIVKQG